MIIMMNYHELARYLWLTYEITLWFSREPLVTTGFHPSAWQASPSKGMQCVCRNVYIYTYIWVMMVSIGNHPQMALIQVSEIL